MSLVFYLKMLGLMGVGVLFMHGMVYGYFLVGGLYRNGLDNYAHLYIEQIWTLFITYSAIVGVSLWAVGMGYDKASGRRLFLRVFGAMGLGVALFYAGSSGYTLVHNYYYYGDDY